MLPFGNTSVRLKKYSGPFVDFVVARSISKWKGKNKL